MRNLLAQLSRPVNPPVLPSPNPVLPYSHAHGHRQAPRSPLDHEARRRGVPKSVVIRESLERTLAESREQGEGPSCLDLVADLVGIFDGPADSSTNKEYLYEALERDHRRKRRRPR